jgi:predicted transposase YbfD/YdcC
MKDNDVQKGYIMPSLPENSILSYFADLDDPRRGQYLSHPLINIITIAILGTLCGADGWTEIEEYGKAKQEWLATFLELRKGIPSHDTFGRVFSWLDPDQFHKRFMEWTQQLCDQTDGQLVSLDGKKLRGSKDGTHGKDGIWIVSAWMQANRLVLGQYKVDEKSNEITALPLLLNQLDITGCIVTIDAMGTQTEIAETIINGNADYILAVKKNHKSLFEDIEMLFEGFEQNEYHDVEYDSYKQITDAHSRREIRHCWVVHHHDYLTYLRKHEHWSGLKSLIKLVTVRQHRDKTTVTSRYFISSWQGSAQQTLHYVRDHWHIENNLHWVLDIAFREDDSRIRTQHAPQNMATLRHLALNLLKQDTSLKVGLKAKRKRAGWDNHYLAHVLCP